MSLARFASGSLSVYFTDTVGTTESNINLDVRDSDCSLEDMRFSLIFVLVGALQLCSCARILFLIPMPAKSHYNLGDRFIEELLKRGHEVTIVAPFKKSHPLKNLNEIVLPDLSKELLAAASNPQMKEGKFSMRHMNALSFLHMSYMGSIVGNSTLSYPEVKKLIHSDQKFDLVLGECFLTEGMLAGFSHRFKAPIAAIATFMPNVWVNEMVGNPYPTAYVPDPILGYTDKMSFQERLFNFLYTTISQVHHHVMHLSKQDELMREHFGKDLPYIKDILKKTSLVLVNHHFSLAFPRPYLPNVIEVGSYHIKPPKPLPQDLQKFIDQAKDGVIYFSMGSNLESSEFPKEKFDSILRTFSRLKQRVLWKFEKENPPNLPENVMISKWLPQSDVLAHPNVKLFITHGGLLSFTESVLRGVPVVGIPIFGDQPINVRYIVRLGLGVRVDYDDLGKDDVLFNAIQEVLNNPKYRNNMKLRSKLLQDVPLSPIDTAIYWLEYVIRHKGAPHLISGAQELPWYQLYLLDIYAFIGSVVFGVVLVLRTLAYCLLKTFWGKKKVSPSKKKN